MSLIDAKKDEEQGASVEHLQEQDPEYPEVYPLVVREHGEEIVIMPIHSRSDACRLLEASLHVWIMTIYGSGTISALVL